VHGIESVDSPRNRNEMGEDGNRQRVENVGDRDVPEISRFTSHPTEEINVSRAENSDNVESQLECLASTSNANESSTTVVQLGT